MVAVLASAQKNLRIPLPNDIPEDSLQSPPPFPDSKAERRASDTKEDYIEGSLSVDRCYRETARVPGKKARRKNDSILASLCQLIVQHQIGTDSFGACYREHSADVNY